MKTIALLLVCCCFCHLNGQEPATDPVDFELDGLIFDQTRTRIGRDFYEDFFTKWAQPDSVSNYSILLEEQPSRGRLGYLEVKVNEITVAAYHLQPGIEWMEAAVRQTIERLTDYLLGLGQMQLDLESGDQSGSGIY